MKRKRVGVLISGRGSNMAALVEAARDPAYPAEIVCVVSNRRDAAGLKFAQGQNISTHVIDHKNYTTRESFDAALNDYLQSQKSGPDRLRRVHAHHVFQCCWNPGPGK